MVGKKIAHILLRHGNPLSLEVGVGGQSGTGIHRRAPLFLSMFNLWLSGKVNETTFPSLAFERRMIPELRKKFLSVIIRSEGMGMPRMGTGRMWQWAGVAACVVAAGVFVGSAGAEAPKSANRGARIGVNGRTWPFKLLIF